MFIFNARGTIKRIFTALKAQISCYQFMSGIPADYIWIINQYTNNLYNMIQEQQKELPCCACSRIDQSLRVYAITCTGKKPLPGGHRNRTLM